MLIFIDIETTGVEITQKLCSIALVHDTTYIYELLNEGKKIPPEASSIHHITNEAIRNKKSFLQSKSYQYLELNNNEETLLVGHNIVWILQLLSAAGFVYKGCSIDTCRVSKHLVPECDLFSLQILRYELRLYKEEEKIKYEYGIKDALVAHNALSDALIVKLLYNYLLEMSTCSEMQSLTQHNVLLEKLTFGKYKGKYIEEICMNDRAYLEWLTHNAKDIDEDMLYSIEHHL